MLPVPLKNITMNDLHALLHTNPASVSMVDALAKHDTTMFKSCNQLVTSLAAKVSLIIAKLTHNQIEAKGSLCFFQTARDIKKELFAMINNLRCIYSKSNHQSSACWLQFPKVSFMAEIIKWQHM